MVSNKENYDGLNMLFIKQNPQKNLRIELQLQNTFLFGEKASFQKKTGNSQCWFQLAHWSFQLATRNSRNKCNSQLATRTISATRNSQKVATRICNSQLALYHITFDVSSICLQYYLNFCFDSGAIANYCTARLVTISYENPSGPKLPHLAK